VGAEGGKEKPDRGAEVADTPEGAITDIGQILARVPIGIGSFRSRPHALSKPTEGSLTGWKQGDLWRWNAREGNYYSVCLLRCCVRSSPSRPEGSRVVPCGFCCRWSLPGVSVWVFLRVLLFSGPVCPPSEVRRPFPPCFNLVRVIIYLGVQRRDRLARARCGSTATQHTTRQYGHGHQGPGDGCTTQHLHICPSDVCYLSNVQ
jgi:hypothetical protein